MTDFCNYYNKTTLSFDHVMSIIEVVTFALSIANSAKASGLTKLDDIALLDDFAKVDDVISIGIDDIIGVDDVITSIDDLVDTENFTDTALNHIFEGEINKNGKASGYHVENFPNTRGSIIPGTKTEANELGFYEGKVMVDGVEKTAYGGISTFFPVNWGYQKIVDVINEAYENRKHLQRNEYFFDFPEGYEIHMYLNSNNKIISAFPVMKKEKS